ncbi:hypothetical protein Ancab_029110 [Ancistrocladus abbreviatus]
MALVSRTRSMLEELVRDGSFKWLMGSRSSFKEEFEEMVKSPTGRKNWIGELSPVANVVVRRCSRILGVSMSELQEDFNAVASDLIKEPSHYARNLLEYCCFRALALSTHVMGYLADKKFRRLTFDMMLAWESPAAASQPLLNMLQVDEDATVGLEAFSRIAPAVPIIANVVISDNLFEVLTASSDGRLQYTIYEKYLICLERAIKKLKSQSESSLLSALRSERREKILELDGTVTTQPVLQHAGISTWPGRLTLTDHALYFEPLRVVSYDKAKRYDLADDLKQIVKPELTGPWGTRLFDKAVLYKSISLLEPVVMEFPELKGHTRRDYWLAIIQEIIFVHRFICKFRITGVEREEALWKAILGVMRLQAIQELSSAGPLRCDALLIFSLCDQLPGGDLILETMANMSASREQETTSNPVGSAMYSISAMGMASSLGFGFGSSSQSHDHTNSRLLVGDIVVGDMTPLEMVVKESKSSYQKVVRAQETVDGVKVDGIDTNLAVMKELLLPIIELGVFLLSVAYWEEPLKSLAFCLVFTFIIIRGWISYSLALLLILFAVFMMMSRILSQGQPLDEIKVAAPPAKNTMEQLLAVQNAITQVEELIQDGNIALLKIRGLLLSIFPQASEKCAMVLLVLALVLALLPVKYIVLLSFLEAFTRYSPPRKASSERFRRRLREWWFSIPAAPVVLESDKEDKKRK